MWVCGFPVTAFEMRVSSSGGFLVEVEDDFPVILSQFVVSASTGEAGGEGDGGKFSFYGISGCDVIGSDMLSDVKSHVCQFFIVADEVGHFFVGYFGAGRLFFVLII